MNAAVKPMIDLPAVPERAADWREGLEPKGKGFVGDVRNVLLVALRLAPELAGLVHFNEFALRVEFTRSPPWRAAGIGTPCTDEDDTALQAWLQEQRVEVRQRNIVSDCIALVAKDHSTHPVRDYPQSLQWGASRACRYGSPSI